MVNNSQTNEQYKNLTIDELFLLYKETKANDVKSEIAMRHMYIVKSIAIQMRNVYIGFEQIDDIIQEGVIIILKAIDKFDPSLNIKFDTFVSKRMRGMIIDLARKQDWVPRTLRKQYNDINEFGNQYYKEHGKKPSDKEICDSLDLTDEKYHEVMGKSSMFSVLSLEATIEETGELRKKNIQFGNSEERGPEEHVIINELKGTLSQAIQTLREKEQLVISLYYVEELNMKEIAKVLEISEPRVSQIHANAIKKMKKFMEENIE